jgi:eukaryotic-like serine/threonine-protein kinase
MPQHGSKLGPYTLHELINTGGMCEIWLATNEAGQAVAVRLLLDSSPFAFTERKRFVTGAEVLQACQDSRHIIRYIEHGKIGGEMALIIEYVEGENLKLRMAAGDPVLAENVGQVLIDMAESLEVVHDRGFMHLDFKPENVLLTRNGSLRLVDFDLARKIPDAPRKLEKNPGTPHYMSPEQLLREPVDHRADIWAYGVSAYEILASRKPFPGENPDEVLRRQLDRTDFIPLRELNSEVPPALDRVILRCLDRDPEQRHPNASVLVHELKKALYV